MRVNSFSLQICDVNSNGCLSQEGANFLLCLTTKRSQRGHKRKWPGGTIRWVELTITKYVPLYTNSSTHSWAHNKNGTDQSRFPFTVPTWAVSHTPDQCDYIRPRPLVSPNCLAEALRVPFACSLHRRHDANARYTLPSECRMLPRT